MNNVDTEQYKAELEVRYGIHYNVANERLFRRLKFGFDFVGLFAGSTALAGAVADKPALAAAGGVIVAALTVVSQLLAPGEAAVRFNEAYRRFTDLDRQSATMTPTDIRAAISAIRTDVPWGLSTLGPVAYNQTMLANGRSDALMAVSRWQRFVAIFA